MKKTIAYTLITIGLTVAPAAAASADIYDTVPACTIYVSDQTVPVSGECEPYYLNGKLIFNAISINEGK